MKPGCIKNIQQMPSVLNKEIFVVAGSKSHMNEETEKYIQSLDTKGNAAGNETERERFENLHGC
jgi:hypothetical protein